MGRIHGFEFGDQTWFPSIWRELLTDFLGYIGNLNATPYQPFVEKLHAAMKLCCTDQILDLGAGGGGPSPSFAAILREQNITLTFQQSDLSPNLPRLQQLAADHEGFRVIEESVDATKVPPHLEGFRLLSNVFHHFRPLQARQILADAVRQQQGIAIFETLGRSPLALLSTLFSPLSLLLMTPMIRPFRWSRLLFTYLCPMLLPIVMWDGLFSCLRVYSPTELHALVQSLEEENVDPSCFDWDIGNLKPAGPLPPFTYLIGTPKAS